MELRSLPREQVMQAWPDISPLLDRIVGKDSREDILDVAGSLLKGEYHALIVVEDGKPLAVVIVQLNSYRHERVAHITYVAGNKLTDWIHYIDSVCEWCKAQGFTSVEGTGRTGWEKALAARGFSRMSSTIRKRL